MDFSSNSFLIVTLAMFAIAVFAVVEGWIRSRSYLCFSVWAACL